jgi:RNA ligase (TIGR02306 family)
MERKLTKIVYVDNVEKHYNADSLDICTIRGWKVVTKRDEFKKGDFAVYFEVDSFLPIRPEFEFLRKSSYKKMGDREGFRLRTVKLRGQLSQGLLLPISILEGPDEMKIGYSDQPWGKQLQVGPYDNALIIQEGEDVTEYLSVVKYEPPIPAQLSGKVRGGFPSWGRKTDQERVQNLVNEVMSEMDKGSKFEVTIKLDGSSMSVGHNNGDVVVCSRNLSLDLEQEGNTFVTAAKELGLIDKIKEFGNIVISGELCGPGIQGNKEGLKKHEFYVFDIFNVDTQTYMSPDERYEICHSLNLNHVHVIAYNVSLNVLKLKSIEDILSYAEGPSLYAKNREGVVFKRMDGEFSFKAISNSWLLENE